ncbi:MAG: hypothetical protein V1743_00935 [Nanoarchaeota archaeon]
MELVHVERKGESLFSNLFFIEDDMILHKQMELRGKLVFFRVRKRTSSTLH